MYRRREWTSLGGGQQRHGHGQNAGDSRSGRQSESVWKVLSTRRSETTAQWRHRLQRYTRQANVSPSQRLLTVKSFPALYTPSLPSPPISSLLPSLSFLSCFFTFLSFLLFPPIPFSFLAFPLFFPSLPFLPLSIPLLKPRPSLFLFLHLIPFLFPFSFFPYLALPSFSFAFRSFSVKGMA